LLELGKTSPIALGKIQSWESDNGGYRGRLTLIVKEKNPEETERYSAARAGAGSRGTLSEQMKTIHLSKQGSTCSFHPVIIQMKECRLPQQIIRGSNPDKFIHQRSSESTIEEPVQAQ
jgi:hypothetical protein